MLTLTEKIQNQLIGADYMGITETEELLSALVGKEVKHYDTWIDDGADGDETEDQYVMGAGFSTRSDDVIVRIYYGDVSEEIGYVDVEDNREE